MTISRMVGVDDPQLCWYFLGIQTYLLPFMCCWANSSWQWNKRGRTARAYYSVLIGFETDSGNSALYGFFATIKINWICCLLLLLLNLINIFFLEGNCQLALNLQLSFYFLSCSSGVLELGMLLEVSTQPLIFHSSSTVPPLSFPWHNILYFSYFSDIYVTSSVFVCFPHYCLQ